MGRIEGKERLCLIGLSALDFLRPREKLLLVEMMEKPSRVLELTLADLTRLLGRVFSTRLWNPEEVVACAERTDRRLTAEGIDSIFYGDSTYPPQLRLIFDPPVTLFLRGTLPENGCALAGIVGTRFPTGAARTAAFRLGFECAREGIGVVSGLARGIDREAHEGSVAAGGVNVAVLGSGIDEVYPSSSRAAARALIDRGGAILSEYPPGTPPLSWHFPARNRIISGLSRSVVVVQAPAKSGALITAEFALEQGRDLYVHAAGIGGSTGEGTRRLKEQGAPVIEGVADILRDWGREPRPVPAGAVPDDLPEGRRLAALVEREMEGACVNRAGDIYWRA
jgi:DNA processing protein